MSKLPPTHAAIVPDAGKVILGVAASDAHAVANHLIAHYLRGLGFQVINLGVCTPVSEFMGAYDEHRDALAIAIGSMNGHALQDLRELKLLKQRHQVRCPVILGGNLSVGSRKRDGLEADLQEVGVTMILESPEQLGQHLLRLRDQQRAAAPIRVAAGGAR
ncbi:cobalamin-dependent protein [Chondromyces apiculatus]|uniref:Methylaspartate mutase S chain n=1 Tax=Chondromyces apiculatus DSM 436 TaxID=1192034 RepID=A0A017T896_9BACT|nr:cobalamin-dependent protein [Chondromyces apiculatus]EYF05459.1 Methylaspartate mutase S chain [Chondromyces apiculatus DSM 436]